MSKVIIVGHGSYGTSIKDSLEMLMGETTGIYYVDFDADDDLHILEYKLQSAVKQCGEDNILFACDLAGGSPFKQCAFLCVENPGYVTVTGLNIAAFADMVYNLDLSIDKLAEMVMDTAHAAIMRFPEQ